MAALALKHLWHNDGYVANWIKDPSFLGYDTLLLDEYFQKFQRIIALSCRCSWTTSS